MVDGIIEEERGRKEASGKRKEKRIIKERKRAKSRG